jgi:hypothetical protein
MGRLFLAFALLTIAAPAWPCSIVGPLPSAERVVRDAVVIARARAEGLSETRVALARWTEARLK